MNTSENYSQNQETNIKPLSKLDLYNNLDINDINISIIKIINQIDHNPTIVENSKFFLTKLDEIYNNKDLKPNEIIIKIKSLIDACYNDKYTSPHGRINTDYEGNDYFNVICDSIEYVKGEHDYNYITMPYSSNKHQHARKLVFNETPSRLILHSGNYSIHIKYFFSQKFKEPGKKYGSLTEKRRGAINATMPKNIRIKKVLRDSENKSPYFEPHNDDMEQWYKNVCKLLRIKPKNDKYDEQKENVIDKILSFDKAEESKIYLRYLLKRDFDAALDHINKFIKIYGESIFLLAQRLEIYRLNDNQKLAQEDEKKILSLKPIDDIDRICQNYALCVNIFNSLLYNKEFEIEKTIVKVKDIVKENQNIPHYWFLLGLLYQLDDKIKESNESFENAKIAKERQEEKHHNIINESSLLKTQLMGFEVILKQFSLNIDYIKYVRLDSNATENYNSENFQKAVILYSKLIELKPNEQNYYLYRGFSYSKVGQEDKAEADLKKALEINSFNSEAWLYLGHIQFNSKNYISAIKSYDKALKINENNFNALKFRGISHSELKNNNQAIVDLKKAKKLSPNDNEIDEWINYLK